MHILVTGTEHREVWIFEIKKKKKLPVSCFNKGALLTALENW